MTNTNELLQKRAEMYAKSRALFTKAVETEKRALTAAEHEENNRYTAEIDALDLTIQADKEMRARARQEAGASEEHRENAAGGKGREADDVNKAFRSFLRSGNMGSGKGREEFVALQSEQRAGLQSDSDGDGGYLIAPQMFVKELIKNVDDAVIVRSKARVITVTGTDSLGVPTLTANPDDADWTAEITSVADDASMKFGKRELRPKPLSKEILVSRPLMRNSALPIDEIVADRLAYKMAIPQEKGFLTGTGANQPLGIFTASADGVPTTQDVSTGNTTTAFTFDGLSNVKFKLKAQYQKTAEWFFHRDAVKMLSQLKDGFGQYLWQPSRQVTEPDMLLGRPVNMSEYAPNTFTTGLYVGAFCDLSYYWIAESLQLEIQRLDELYAKTNQVGFIARAYIDGQPVLAEAFARVKLA